jgi:hypothetical protein
MELIGIIAFFVLLYVLSRPKTQEKSIACCKHHKWVYRTTDSQIEYMICDVCNRTPQMCVNEADGSVL